MAEHYFSADPHSDLARSPVVVEAWGETLRLHSASGVFSHGRVDRGTAVLLRESEPPEDGTVLDLGCGYGVIGLAVAAASPRVSVWAVDVNERALRVATDNAAQLGLEDRFRAVTPDRVPAGLRFDAVWSNPPIRIGKEALHALLLTWLPRLAPEGSARLVVSKNLGADSLARWLTEQGYAVARPASAKGFRVLVVSPAGPA